MTFNHLVSHIVTLGGEERMDKSIWEAGLERVKARLNEMPEAHRARIREISQDDFSELVKELEATKASYLVESSASHQARLAGRYEHIYGVLIRCVSLRLIGVPRERIMHMVYRCTGKGPELSKSREQSGFEMGRNEETFTHATA